MPPVQPAYYENKKNTTLSIKRIRVKNLVGKLITGLDILAIILYIIR